jgi:hypothetical protein
MAMHAEVCGFDSVWASDHLIIPPHRQQYQALAVQHLVLDFVPDTIDNALATMDRFAREVRPALG